MSHNENRKNKDEQESTSPAVPFFVRYLEGQLEDLSEEESESIGGAICGAFVTKKFPSDYEDGNFGVSEGSPVTLKFPSDHEDGSPNPGTAVTLKFPSDHEDGSPLAAVTLKFPSDNDDFPGS